MNVTEATLQTVVELLAGFQPLPERPEPNRLDVRLTPEALVPAVVKLHAAHWGYLGGITGLDRAKDGGELEVLYHFCRGAAVLTLRVAVPRAAPVVPSLCQVLASAGLLERELSEMLGITVTGLAQADHLFLPDDWPAGVYPFRKEPLPADLAGSVGQTV